MSSKRSSASLLRELIQPFYHVVNLNAQDQNTLHDS